MSRHLCRWIRTAAGFDFYFSNHILSILLTQQIVVNKTPPNTIKIQLLELLTEFWSMSRVCEG